jgi:hypothetical protein
MNTAYKSYVCVFDHIWACDVFFVTTLIVLATMRLYLWLQLCTNLITIVLP